jgi:hypothetical protein
MRMRADKLRLMRIRGAHLRRIVALLRASILLLLLMRRRIIALLASVSLVSIIALVVAGWAAVLVVVRHGKLTALNRYRAASDLMMACNLDNAFTRRTEDEELKRKRGF